MNQHNDFGNPDVLARLEAIESLAKAAREGRFPGDVAVDGIIEHIARISVLMDEAA